jgi:hypothetical protein
MTSPLQVLFFLAITLAPPGTHHVIISGGSQAYCWDRGDQADDVDAWAYDWAAVDPKQVLISNDIVPADFSAAERDVVKCTHRTPGSEFVLRFDDAHQLEKNSLGYVYVVRPGSPNQKFYSFTYR